MTTRILNDMDIPAGMKVAFSYDGEWTYFHYKGITCVVVPSDDGNYRIVVHVHGPVYIDLEIGFTTRDDAEKRGSRAVARRRGPAQDRQHDQDGVEQPMRGA